MSIAHSVMLLVTLLFVLTTRGINLDFGTTARNARGIILTPPASSPPPQTHARVLLESSSFVADPRDHLTHCKNKQTDFVAAIHRIQSAPASPAATSKAWSAQLHVSHDIETRLRDERRVNTSEPDGFLDPESLGEGISDTDVDTDMEFDNTTSRSSTVPLM
jgi:hypothetical protein